MKKIVEYAGCFVCGMKNDDGLRIEFFEEEGEAHGEFIPQATFQGYRDILHGGITSALLDEVMIKAILARGILTVTAEMRVKFRKPVRIGERVQMIGRVENERGRVITTRGEVRRNGEIVAEGWGKYIRIVKGDEIG